jgi:hypothetical protein
VVLQEDLAQIAEGDAGVEDVFDDDDVLALDGLVEILDELDGAAGGAAFFVAGDSDEIEGAIDVDAAREVSQRKMAAPLSTPIMMTVSPA